jgi:hypothetical protein
MQGHLRFQLIGTKNKEKKVFASFDDKATAMRNLVNLPRMQWESVELVDTSDNRQIAALVDICPSDYRMN